MKQLFFVLSIALTTTVSFGQSNPIDLPASTLIPRYRLSVSYNTTTVLVFAAAVRPIDRGDRDILAIKQPGVENVLKVKAGRRNFAPTNLHVFTADGVIYAFDVTYTDSMACSRDLTAMHPTNTGSPVIVLSGQLVNDAALSKAIQCFRDSADNHRLLRVKHEQMLLGLDDIAQRDGLLFVRLRLHNRSSLRYQFDFLRSYIRDRQMPRRTSIQEQPLPLTYQDSVSAIEGRGTATVVIVLPIFTLADGKEAVIEVLEKNGGRSLTLHLRNKILLKARNF